MIGTTTTTTRIDRVDTLWSKPLFSRPHYAERSVATTAIAREMVGFIWAIAQIAPPPLPV